MHHESIRITRWKLFVRQWIVYGTETINADGDENHRTRSLREQEHTEVHETRALSQVLQLAHENDHWGLLKIIYWIF